MGRKWGCLEQVEAGSQRNQADPTPARAAGNAVDFLRHGSDVPRDWTGVEFEGQIAVPGKMDAGSAGKRVPSAAWSAEGSPGLRGAPGVVKALAQEFPARAVFFVTTLGHRSHA